MTNRMPPRGGSGETYTAERRQLAPPLLEYPDVDGSPVYFDPLAVTAIRETIDKSRGLYVSLVFVGVVQGTTQVLQVVERAGVIGLRVNMARRGYATAMADAITDPAWWQTTGAPPARLRADAPRNAAASAARDDGSGMLYVPETIPAEGREEGVLE